ncbi:trypsin-like peptidase domain-containing protein [Streptomyces sp. NBC_00887]|uniref:trypsin-like peptidase domain-containing protein n=1 Tax=Streptomyces sp. NBC_00887 TaxID=2975859 RepID=UPI0038677C23|nr:trypsin-like peptidase domain-containing protein [Streptomyces sp. NBC_00887]WSY35629.1 trypsin-like peptidase domain-containing protein [Streptomyces sp. NBC_00887]
MNAAVGSGPRPGTDAWVAAAHGTEHDEKALGSGFLIDDHRVLTCAHVACPTWERTRELWVAFPKSDQFMDRRFRVRDVFAPEAPAKHRAQDVAVLVLSEPVSGEPAGRLRRPTPSALVGDAWWAFGFPDGDLFGNSSDGTVGEALAYGWVRLDTASRYPVKPGYSGAALWSSTYQAIVGLVGQASGSGDARAFTLYQADRCLPEQKIALLADWSAEAAGETALAAWGWTLDDDPEAGRHWKPRARGVSTDSEKGFRFRGRTAALAEIIGWMTCVTAPRKVLMVTGSPGVGKSAVLGRVVTSADFGIAASLPADDDALRAPLGAVSCAVHAKGKTALEVAEEIAAAASAAPPERASDLASVLRAALSERAASAQTPFVIVIDALDEATSAQQARLIARHIAIPLAETCADLHVRVLVGSRRRDDAGSLLDPFGAAVRVIDLDTPEFFATADLAAYTMATLQLLGDERPDNPYADKRTARPVAARIAELADANFLVAGLTARAHGLHDTRAVAPADIAFTPTVAAALEEYLSRLPAVDGAPAADALSVLAYAEAPGLPLPLWSAAVEKLTGHHLTENQLRSLARSSAANFLIESGVSDQNTGVFRLFHQALNDALRQNRAQLGSNVTDERALTRSFISYGRRLGWDRAPAYLLRSLPRHAVGGRVIDELLADAEYALHADLRRLIPASSSAVSRAAKERAQVLRRTPQAIDCVPTRRAALFSVTEAQEGFGQVYGPLAVKGPYRAEWAAVASRAEDAILEGHSGEIRAVCALGPPTGTLLASAAGDGTVRLWDPVTARTVRRLTPKFGRVSAMCGLIVDGQTYLALAADRDVWLWNESLRRAAGYLRGHVSSIRDLCAFETADGPRLATGSADGTVRIWDPASRECTAVLSEHGGWVESVCTVAVNHGTLLASGGDEDDRSIILWRPDTGERVHILEGHESSVIALSAVEMGDHTLLASLGDDKTVRLWDPISGWCVSTLPGEDLAFRLRALTVEGKSLLASPSGDLVRLLDPESGRIAITLQGHSDSVDSLCVLHVNGRDLIASGGADHTVRLWDPSAPRASSVSAVRALSPASSGNGLLLAAGGDDGVTQLRDPGSGSVVNSLSGNHDWVRALCTVTHLNRSYLAGCGDDGAVWLSDLTEAVPRSSRRPGNKPAYTVCSVRVGDQTLLATGHTDGSAWLWDPLSNETAHFARFHSGIYAMCPLEIAGQPYVATATDGQDGAVWLWDATSGQRHKLVAATETLAMCALPMMGQTALATAHAHGEVCLWDAARGEPIGALSGHSGAVNAVSMIGEGGTFLASASSDRTVRLWDVSGQALVEEIPVHHPALAVTWVSQRLIVGLDHGLLALSLGEVSSTPPVGEPEHLRL